MTPVVLSYLIKPADINDAPAILALQKMAFRSEAELYNNYKLPPLLQSLESIKEDFAVYRFFKLLIENQIVGSLKVRLIDNNILWIGRLIIHPEFQNRGLGKALMQFIEQEYQQVAGFELFTGEKSIRNIHFYKGQGYSITGTYNEPENSDIVIVKMIKMNQNII
jgi:ribosomal protein S18 acetylase RimI-like enzyme